MEPFAFEALRRGMGLTVSQMAAIVGLEGLNACDRVREIERGARPVSGPILKVLRYLSQGVATYGAGSVVQWCVPRWLKCQDLERPERSQSYILHTRWPRFVAWLAEPGELDVVSRDALRCAGVPVIPLPRDGVDLVVLYIDQPPTEVGELMAILKQLVVEKCI
jgi:hypothetical protein